MALANLRWTRHLLGSACRHGIDRLLVTCLFVATALPLLAPGPVDADAAPVNRYMGGAPVPVRNEQISLRSEKVDIYVFRNWAYVEAEFNLHNFGPATELLVGFPETRLRPDKPLNCPTLVEFTSEVDGHALPVTFASSLQEKPDLRYYGWHVYTIAVGSGRDAVLRNTYFTDLTDSGKGKLATYVLETGALWRDRIEKAVITVHPVGGVSLSDIQGGRSANPYAIIYGQRRTVKEDSLTEGNSLVWHLADLEPTADDDVQLYVHSGSPDHVETRVEGSPLRAEGEEITLTLDDHRTPTLVNSSTVTVVAGQQAMPLDSLSVSGWYYRPQVKVTLPSGLIPTYGNAVEIWGQMSDGSRTDSDLVFITPEQGRLPASGGDTSPLTLAIVAGLACLVTSAGLRLMARSRRGVR